MRGFDVIKDRLYCDAPGSISRRSAQTAIYLILDAMVRLLAPILSFTADEIWHAMPHAWGDNAESVLLNDMPSRRPEWAMSDGDAGYWNTLLSLRDSVNKALESARAEKLIGKPLDAKICFAVAPAAEAVWNSVKDADLEQLFIVSELAAGSADGMPEGYAPTAIDGLSVRVEPSAEERCARCWTRSATVGSDSEHPELCARCAAVIRG